MQIGRIYTENRISGLYGIAQESGRKRKKLREKGARIGTRKYKTALTSEAGRAQVHTSPTPEQEATPELAPSPHPCQAPPLPPSRNQRSSALSTAVASVMTRASAKTVVKRTRDETLEHVRAALRENSNPLTKQEMSFIRTSCHILGIDGGSTAKAIVKVAKDKGKKQPRKVMEHLQSQLRELAEKVEKHKRPTPNPAASTRAVDAMGAPARSLGNLLGCAEALREATKGQYSKGIKAAIKAMENAKLDFKATIDRVAEASKWKEGTIEDWIGKDELACGNLVEKAEEVLKEAEAREEAEAKIQIMEGQCEELADLATQAGKQVPAEAEVEVLEELEEEIDQRKEMVGDLGRALRETVPEELKDRMEEAMKESVVIATKGRRYVDHVKTRLDFFSARIQSRAAPRLPRGLPLGDGRPRRRSSGRCSRRGASRKTTQKTRRREPREWPPETCWTS
jgi:hypothetical protein